jgi:hypothetical protein
MGTAKFRRNKMIRKSLFALVLLLAAAMTACQPAAQPTQAPAAATEVMQEDEMMETTEVMTEEMMEETEEPMAETEEAMMEGTEEMMDDLATTTFVIRIENAAADGGLTILAPGAYELNDHPVSFFTPGEGDRGAGLEPLAEDGNPGVLVDNVNEMMAEDMMSFISMVFNTPVGADSPGPAGPGAAYEFTVDAYAGQYLTFATMFVQSNDWFFAPGADGIQLFDADGNPIAGDITDQVFLWDAGTEVDQTPGEGADQAPRQAGPDTGEAENGAVELVEGFQDYQIIVTITPQQ